MSDEVVEQALLDLGLCTKDLVVTLAKISERIKMEQIRRSRGPRKNSHALTKVHSMKLICCESRLDYIGKDVSEPASC